MRRVGRSVQVLHCAVSATSLHHALMPGLRQVRRHASMRVLAQARWAVRDPAGRGGGLSGAAAGAIARRGQGDGTKTGAQDRGVPYAHTQPHRCAATAIRTRVALPASTRYRLVGVELSGSVDADRRSPICFSLRSTQPRALSAPACPASRRRRRRAGTDRHHRCRRTGSCPPTRRSASCVARGWR